MSKTMLAELARKGAELLSEDDPVLYELLEQEYERQNNSLAMVAASSIADLSVLVCEGMATTNVTAEGYPGARFHAGCRFVDGIEGLAIERAKLAFQARYANVQPHSGTTANQIVMFSLLKPGETILGLELNSGGHLTHGAKPSVSGQYFNAVAYGLDQDALIDYEQVARLAREHRPKLIITGASAYPRIIDFQRFRRIADEVGAFLLADISHIAGLVVAGEHPSPINHAHFTTTSTYKQLYGPRGGLIMIGNDFDKPAPDGKQSLSEAIQRAVFPFFQGTPNLSAIAAKARALARTTTPEFKALARRIIVTARALAECFASRGYQVLTGGTDNHIVLINLMEKGLTGLVAELALEECHVIVNRNRIPQDRKAALITSGIRLGTNSLALRGMGAGEMARCAALIDMVLSSLKVVSDREYELDQAVKERVRAEVRRLCDDFPIPRYPAAHKAQDGRLYDEPAASVLIGSEL
ncbi:MAG TPA: serine hydroxymethyltransferase [Pyrinomonadaceae bacterium]|jgi:glycine hydroxymethyltransferase